MLKSIHSIKGETKTKNKVNGFEAISNAFGSNTFINALKKNTSYGETANGALTYTKSLSYCLDFFAQAGAMRDKKKEAVALFKKAYAESPLVATRLLFYMRDIRGGNGERALFRACLEEIASMDYEVFKAILKYVPEYGRWDDMFYDIPEVYALVKEGLLSRDLLLAKWLPTINASSAHTKAKAKVMAKGLGLSDLEYRRIVRSLRKELKAVEELMSANKWREIIYERVPSRANKIYSEAFLAHDKDRRETFLKKAEKGEVAINSGTLYPYEIFDMANEGKGGADALWANLPDYTRGTNSLVVADVSGSMTGRPMSVSVSLALYFADKNKGTFKDCFITFSSKPELQYVPGGNLIQRMSCISRSHWEMNTDLQAVFNLVLRTIIDNNVPIAEQPETIYIISDMEFDACVTGGTNLDVIRAKYAGANVKMPNLVFWNVDSSGSNLPSYGSDRGVTMVSGFSPSNFKLAVEGKTAIDLMQDVVSSERYNKIII